VGVNPQLDLIALALSGKKVGFEKVITMIDNMVGNLKTEQGEDDSKKDYCESSLDKADDKRKSLENSISDSETSIAEMQGTLVELNDEIAQLEAGIKALDASVAEATDLRKQENADYKNLMSDDSTAKELLLYAKNRLNKYYNPKLYKPPPARELSREDQIVEGLGGNVPTEAPGGIAGTGIGAAFVEVSLHSQREAPPPPPETFGPYSNKNGNGVVAMIDLLVSDLDKEMQEADVTEKNSQANYEIMMKESGSKRASDSKSITDKSTEKASTEEALQAEEDAKTDTGAEHMATMKHIASLHGECDWLLKYFEIRKRARSDEVESLNNAKAALSGASYSLL
jgi:septal ring factor EnvC (AmiA/AmiB activator)